MMGKEEEERQFKVGITAASALENRKERGLALRKNARQKKLDRLRLRVAVPRSHASGVTLDSVNTMFLLNDVRAVGAAPMIAVLEQLGHVLDQQELDPENAYPRLFCNPQGQPVLIGRLMELIKPELHSLPLSEDSVQIIRRVCEIIAIMTHRKHAALIQWMQAFIQADMLSIFYQYVKLPPHAMPVDIIQCIFIVIGNMCLEHLILRDLAFESGILPDPLIAHAQFIWDSRDVDRLGMLKALTRVAEYAQISGIKSVPLLEFFLNFINEPALDDDMAVSILAMIECANPAYAERPGIMEKALYLIARGHSLDWDILCLVVCKAFFGENAEQMVMRFTNANGYQIILSVLNGNSPRAIQRAANVLFRISKVSALPVIPEIVTTLVHIVQHSVGGYGAKVNACCVLSAMIARCADTQQMSQFMDVSALSVLVQTMSMFDNLTETQLLIVAALRNALSCPLQERARHIIEEMDGVVQLETIMYRASHAQLERESQYLLDTFFKNN
jgi:hypothetical protein